MHENGSIKQQQNIRFAFAYTVFSLHIIRIHLTKNSKIKPYSWEIALSIVANTKKPSYNIRVKSKLNKKISSPFRLF